MAFKDSNEAQEFLPLTAPIVQAFKIPTLESIPETDDTIDSVEACMSHLTTGSSLSSTVTLPSEVDTDVSGLEDGITKTQDADDIALQKNLQDDKIPATADATTIKTNGPYDTWKCGFGFNGKLDAPAAIPNTKPEFLKAVNGELAAIGFIQNGLTSYLKAIHSGVHDTLTEEFLTHQTDATHKTIGQLFQISNNLKDVVKEVEAIEPDNYEVKVELRDAFAHALPWIQRTRAILIEAHIFYKINYVLSSDKDH